MRMATGRFTLEVGRFVSGTIERELRQYAFQKNLLINIEKHMGLFDGVLLISVSGESEKVITFGRVVELLVEKI